MTEIRRFEVYRDKLEVVFGHGKNIPAMTCKELLAAYLASPAQDPECIAACDTLGDASVIYAREVPKCSTRVYKDAVHRAIEADVVYIEEAVYQVDDNGESELDFTDGFDEFYAEPYQPEESKKGNE